MILHYVGIVPYLYFLGDWAYGYRLWERSPANVLIPFEVYLVGQVGIWFSVWKMSTRRTESLVRGRRRR